MVGKKIDLCLTNILIKLLKFFFFWYSHHNKFTEMGFLQWFIVRLNQFINLTIVVPIIIIIFIPYYKKHIFFITLPAVFIWISSLNREFFLRDVGFNIIYCLKIIPKYKPKC